MKCNGRLGGFLSSSSRRNGCVCVHCLAHGNTICDGFFLCIFSLCIAPDDPSSPPPKFYTNVFFFSSSPLSVITFSTGNSSECTAGGGPLAYILGVNCTFKAKV